MDGANPTPGAPPQSLVGPSSSQPSELTQAAPSPEQQSQAFMMQTKDLTMQITALARQFPAGAQDYEFAIQALINAMTKVITSMSSTEPESAPNLVG